VRQAVPSLPYLSLEPSCRRGWGSIDAALTRGRIDAERLYDLLASQLPDGGPPVFAVDVTTWSRCAAECSPNAATATTRPATRPAACRPPLVHQDGVRRHQPQL